MNKLGSSISGLLLCIFICILYLVMSIPRGERAQKISRFCRETTNSHHEYKKCIYGR